MRLVAQYYHFTDEEMKHIVEVSILKQHVAS